MLSVLAVPSFADTTMWTNVYAPGGETHFTETIRTQGAWYGDDTGSGPYSNDPNGKTTAVVTESFDNYGSVNYWSNFESNGNYASFKTSGLEAIGNTAYTYEYAARSLCAGKTEDITEYDVRVDIWTQSADEDTPSAIPGLGVIGTAPGYAGDDASDWSTASQIGKGLSTDEHLYISTYTWTNPDNW